MTTALKGWGPESNPIEGSNVGGGLFGRDLNSKVLARVAVKRKTVFRANDSPKHIRFPIEKKKMKIIAK